MQGCYYPLHLHSNSKTNVVFIQIRAQPLTQKYESIVFHSSSLPKLSPHPEPLQQVVYISEHLFLIPYIFLSMPHILINQAQNYEILPLSLQKQSLNVHNMLYKHVQKHVCSTNKIMFFFLSSIATMLAEIQGTNKPKQEVKPKED